MADKTLAVNQSHAMRIFNHAIHRQYLFSVDKWEDNTLVAITMDSEHWKETKKTLKYIEKIAKQYTHNIVNCPGCELIANLKAQLISAEKHAFHLNHVDSSLI